MAKRQKETKQSFTSETFLSMSGSFDREDPCAYTSISIDMEEKGINLFIEVQEKDTTYINDLILPKKAAKTLAMFILSQLD